MKVKIVNKSNNPLAKYETINSVGMDVRAFLDKLVTIKPMERVMIPTGLYFELPDPVREPLTGEGHAYEIQVRPRSGLAIKKGITIINTPGTLDPDYRGELKLLVVNLSNEPFTVTNGERLAQILVNRIELVGFEEVDKLSETDRGEGGFGHTGKK